MEAVTRLAGAAAAIIAVSVQAPAGASERERHPIDLPAGELGAAVIQLGRQADVSIGISDPALGRIRVPRVRGRYSAHEALKRLLAGTAAD